MHKYRFKLENGRVIGPFLESQIPELLTKGHLKGTEYCQLFPTGDWKSFDSYDFQNKTKTITKTSSAITESKETSSDSTKTKTKFNEFDFTKKDQVGPRNYGSEDKEEYEEVVVAEPSKLIEISKEKLKPQPKQEITETVQKEKVADSSSNSEKTVIRPDTLEYLKKLKEKQLDDDREVKLQKIREIEEKSKLVDLENDGTQIIKIPESNSKEEILNIETELEEDIKNVLIEKKKQSLKTEKSVFDDINEAVDEEAPTKKKKPKLILIVAIALAIFFLLPEEKKVETKAEYAPLYPKISFPQQYNQPNAELAKKNLQAGYKAYEKGDYVSKNEALNLFTESLAHSFNKNMAMTYYVLVASELLPNSKEKLKDGNIIFKVMQIGENFFFKDNNFISGKVAFYYNLEKYGAAVRTVEKFLKLGKPNPKLFAYYLQSCIKMGDMVKAKKVYDKLIEAKKKTIEEYIALIDFELKQDNFENASNILTEALKNNPKSVPLSLIQAELLTYAEDFKSLTLLLQNIKAANFENSPIYYAKYLEYYGLLNVANGQTDKAVELLSKSLSISESPELRFKLARLSAEGDSKATTLILESKAYDFIKSAKKHMKEGNWELAFTNAINAKDTASDYIPAHLILAETQIKQGYFQLAIESLDKLSKKYSDNNEIIFMLINAYIDSFKFTDATKILSIMSNSTMKDDPRFNQAYGRMYFKEGAYAQSLKYFKLAANDNPVDEVNYYYLSQIFFKNKKFNEAKLYLQKAIDLDPTNIDYLISYSSILYETDDAQTAIGYLRDQLIELPDNPKLMGEIGVYYFRSGQIKAFQETKEKLETLPKKDKSLYEFLVRASIMDERFDDTIKYGLELLKMDPGNLEIRMVMAKIFMEKDKPTDALAMLQTISDRLDTYPKLKIYKSKLYLLIGDKEKAKEMALEEIKSNPGLIDGYIQLATIYRDAEDWVNAENMYKQAQKIDGNNIESITGMAGIHLKRAQYEIALDLYKKAEKRDPNNAEVRRLLGDAYRQLGQGSLALEAYKVFLELDPNSKYKPQIESYIKVLE